MFVNKRLLFIFLAILSTFKIVDLSLSLFEIVKLVSFLTVISACVPVFSLASVFVGVSATMKENPSQLSFYYLSQGCICVVSFLLVIVIAGTNLITAAKSFNPLLVDYHYSSDKVVREFADIVLVQFLIAFAGDIFQVITVVLAWRGYQELVYERTGDARPMVFSQTGDSGYTKV